MGQQATEEVKAKRSNARAAWLAWSIWALFVILAALSIPLEYANAPNSTLIELSRQLILLAYMTVGALVASRRPENAVGWIFCAIALCLMFSIFAVDYAVYTRVTRPGAFPFGLAMTWLSILVQQIGFLLAFTFLLLVFPNGKLPSQRWRLVAWLTAFMIVVTSLWQAFKPGPLSFAPSIRNPLGIERSSDLDDALSVILLPLLLATVGACVASVIARFRRATGDERQQIKWFAFASVPVIIIVASIPFESLLASDLQTAYEVLFRLSVAALPIAAGVAILKYRLYDIDVIINRTLVYVPLTAILAGLYSASIALFQKLFVAATGEKSDAAIVLTTLILASTFTPIKNGLQAFVDRRFKEAPDAMKKLRALGEQARSVMEVTDIKQATRRLLDEAVSAFHAESGAVYLWRDGHLQLEHVHGEWSDSDGSLCVPLGVNGEQLGILKLGARADGVEYTTLERETLEQIANLLAGAIGHRSLPRQRTGKTKQEVRKS